MHVVRRLLVIAALCGASVASAASFHTDGPFIRDRWGRAVFFHGVNAVWKRPPYYPPSTLFGAPADESYFDRRDADFLAASGFNTVRLVMKIANSARRRAARHRKAVATRLQLVR